MITAIVLIQAEQGKIPDLAQALLDIPEVAEVYSVAGEFDLVAILRVKEYDAMAEVVPSKLQNLAGVARTTTLMAFQCYSRHDLERLFSIGIEEEEALEESS
jgi:DNA-binding Lrp family transcriptional regulator